MASIKRKAGTDDRPIKRKAVTDDRPTKKFKAGRADSEPRPAKSTKPVGTKVEDRGEHKARPAKSAKHGKTHVEDSVERKPLPKSVLQQEDRSFPRGGASVLTPLEHKQIKAQAERDVLFEQQTGQPVGDEQEDGDLFDRQTAPHPHGKKQKNRRPGQDAANKPEVSGIKIQGLSYKNLVVGSVVLGYVTAITSRDVTLALANNLSGFVPITAISERLNARIEKLLEDERPDADANGDEGDIELKKLFYVGQWLRATVSATSTTSGNDNGKSKRHIELSVDPRQVNGGLTGDSIVPNSMIQASVRSVEDHGIVMDLGLSDPNLKGFISKKELGTAHKLDDFEEGQVLMCFVMGKGSDGKVLKLSPHASPLTAVSGGKQATIVSEAPTVEGFQAGTAVEILVTDSGAGGVVGKVMGMLDVTADVLHAGMSEGSKDMSEKYKIGSKVKGRVIWTTPKDDGSRRVGVSLLEHMLALPPPLSKLPENANPKLRSQATELNKNDVGSTIVEDAKVTQVLAERGLFMTLPTNTTGRNLKAFVHISQISDSRVDTLTANTGPYKVESTHKARIISYNPVDNIHYVSLKPSILKQSFLRIEDLTVGELVKGTIEKLILGAKGVTGLLVKLSDNILGLVPEMHFSDVQLLHPERKFKEGFQVKARVLSVDLEKRHVRLTLKKTFVSEDEGAPIWKNYADLQPGNEGKGTIINMLSSGAVVQFYGIVRAWLPVAEMSETFIEAPEKHFRLGQTVSVRILSIDPQEQEMKVSCKALESFDTDQQEAWETSTASDIVSGTVSEKNSESVIIDLKNGLKGIIRIGHLTDGSSAKADNVLQKIHVGQKLSDILVLDKLERSRHLILTRKTAMVADAKASDLITSYASVQAGKKVNGFVRNITPEGVFTEFANGVVGLLPKSQVASDIVGQPAFGLFKDQSLSVWVMSVDASRERFALSMREQEVTPPKPSPGLAVSVSNAVDPSITSMADFTLGQITKARIASIKATQINVRLADNVQGRIDVSEAFDLWEDITIRKAPLQKFKPNEVLSVKILGVHDARNHRFLPITHRQSSVPVFELSAKKSRIEEASEDLLTMDAVKEDSKYLAFINNHADNCVWVNLSPNVRGRIALMDLSDDPGQLLNLSKNFPIGCALRVSVKSVDPTANRLDLSARTVAASEQMTLQSVSPGMILAGRVTKITERSLHVQLSDNLAGFVPLVEMSDDYDQLNISQYHKNNIVRVCVLDVDLPNKRLSLTLRPSKVLSSSMPIKDAQVTSYTSLKTGDIVRGFVKHIGDKGVYISLGATVDAFVRVSELSDQYIKDWKSIVEVDQLVKGRVTSVDADANHAHLSLKASHVAEDYTPPITIKSLQPGAIITGKVRKVEDFGAFIDIDNTQPRLSGLCHRSEVATRRVEDVRKLYTAGDIVKAKVLSVDVDARKISLGLKASYFAEDGGDEEMEDDDVDDIGVEGDDLQDQIEDGDEGSDLDGGVDLSNVQDMQIDVDESDIEMEEVDEGMPNPSGGLKTSGFDWTGGDFRKDTNGAASDSEPDVAASTKRKRRRPEIKVDMTGDLDKYGSRSSSDFERLLLGQPNDSGLWVQYMAFQLQLSEIQKARDVAERALRTIHIREVEDKANVWTAWLNLEVEYGDDERVEDVFKHACQVQDPLEIHERLASIYIDSGKHDKADAIFDRIVGNKAFRASPDVWSNYANFLMDTFKAPLRARSLLSRALQSIPTNEHRLLTANFAAMEFHSTQGDPERGRTIFEGLLSEWPKWSSGWDMWVDLERSRISRVPSQEAKLEAREQVRRLYERSASQKMKKRRAKFVFKRWLEFEEAEGVEKNVERVKALAREYVEAQQAKGGDEVNED